MKKFKNALCKNPFRGNRRCVVISEKEKIQLFNGEFDGALLLAPMGSGGQPKEMCLNHLQNTIFLKKHNHFCHLQRKHIEEQFYLAEIKLI